MRSAVTLALALGMISSACAGKTNYVQADDVALGRVVVYRNGVAYYERRARVEGDTLKVSVPQARVDDFLKSLTVTDAANGKTLPVSFPRRGQAYGGLVSMTINLPKNRISTDVVLTYVTEAPAWKPSYRVVVGPKGGVTFQGWAIVDNTSGEDWKEVRVGVGSSSALSFRYDLWSVRAVHREHLAAQDKFAVAPPTGVSPYKENRRRSRVVTSFTDRDIPRPRGSARYGGDSADAPAAGTEAITMSRGGAAGNAKTKAVSRHYRARIRRARQEKQRLQRRLQQSKRRIQLLAKKLRPGRSTIYVDGYASSGERNPSQQAQARANTMRNELINNGVAPSRIKVRNRGIVAGRGPGVSLVVEEAPKTDAKKRVAAKGSDRPVGESHFESTTPMTVKRGTSVMVSIVKKSTAGEVVYLYDAESARGNKRFAFKAVRFKNPTPYTLEPGPVTVYGDKRFVGEGFTQPIPPHSSAMVPFALDRQLIVVPLISKRDHIAKLVTLQRGILSAKVQHVRQTRLKITSRLHKPTTVFIRHTGQGGWRLTKTPSKFEKIGRAYLFHVKVAAGETRVIDIEEATPIVKTLDMRSAIGLNMVKVFLSSEPTDPELAEAVSKILGLQTKLSDTNVEIGNLRQRLRDYRVRMDELHGQLVSLKAVKMRGSLMKHLKKKLKDISERVQKATIALVNLEEQAMLTRIKFEDSIAELGLGKKKAKGPVARK